MAQVTKKVSVTYDKLKEECDAIIALPATIVQVVRMNAGEYLIIYNTP
jgi:hypothetical protein